MIEFGQDSRTLIFLPGFMTSASAYLDVLQPAADAGVHIIVPTLYKRGISALLGRFSVVDEAKAAADLVRGTAATGQVVFLGGHSRGGQAAWRAAIELGPDLPAGLVLVDPVDGEGRAPSAPTATLSTPACDMLIIGAGIGGRCAPESVNHDVFAAAAPRAEHIVIEQLGHADMLCDRDRTFGRRLCPGADDPNPGRDECARAIAFFVAG